MDEPRPETDPKPQPYISRDAKGRFLPGRGPGPGRPRGAATRASIARSLRDMLATRVEDGPYAGKTRAEMIALRLYKLAMDGSIAAIREILDRTDGKVAVRFEEVGDGQRAPYLILVSTDDGDGDGIPLTVSHRAALQAAAEAEAVCEGG